jgi:hypothetical protein
VGPVVAARLSAPTLSVPDQDRHGAGGHDGQFTEKGVITDILPVTAMLPKEFQNTFQPTNRNRLAKIKVAAGARFPLNQKVSVTRPYFWTGAEARESGDIYFSGYLLLIARSGKTGAGGSSGNKS